MQRFTVKVCVLEWQKCKTTEKNTYIVIENIESIVMGMFGKSARCRKDIGKIFVDFSLVWRFHL